MRQKENRPSAGDAYGTVPFNCVNDSTDMSEFQDLTYNGLLKAVTDDYLDGLDEDADLPFESIEAELLQATNNAIEEYNLGPRDPNAPMGAPVKDAYPNAKAPADRVRKLKALAPWQVASVIIRLYHAVGIRLNGQEGDGNFDVGVYQSHGERRGLCDTRTETVRRLITALHPGISDVDMRNTENKLRVLVPKVEPCKDKALVPVNNGIFDYENKILLDFDPKYVFTSKSNVDFVPNARNPVIHNDQDGTDWDVVSWMEELSDDPEVVKVLWEVLGASLRPNMPWNKSVWLYSTQGNNGKGTFCALVRNLLGKGSWASIPLKDFGQDFMLEELTRVQAIITDENDVGTYIDKAATLKSVITGDPFLLNRKYKAPMPCLFRGLMIQCVNEIPKLKDKSESMYRRLLVIPFEKRFEGCERKYIKDDYLGRKDVLEYVLFHTLYEMDFDEFSVPEASEKSLDVFRVDNDPLRQFADEVFDQATWDLLPCKFLYDLYRYWFQTNVPQGKMLSRNSFYSSLELIAPEYGWQLQDKVRSANRMDVPEMLILEYQVQEWMNRDYRGNDKMRLAQPDVKDSYRGYVRNKVGSIPAYMVSGETTASEEIDSNR